MAPADTLLAPRDVAAVLGVTPHTLSKWRLAGRGPQYVRLGRAIRYREPDVAGYLAALPVHRSTSEYVAK
jgi:predicted DNA-binding transcriptional regulator AlpA